MTSTNGNGILSVPVDTSAQVSMTLGNGELQVLDLPLADVEVTTNSITGTLGAGEGAITLTTANGNLVLARL
jgi:hypothetical protein